MPDDPAVQAVFEALDEECASLTIPELRGLAQAAVDAHRRQVLASPDAERWARVKSWAERFSALTGAEQRVFLRREIPALLAALADETAARQAAEEERDRCAEELREYLVLTNHGVLKDSREASAIRTALSDLADSWEQR